MCAKALEQGSRRHSRNDFVWFVPGFQHQKKKKKKKEEKGFSQLSTFIAYLPCAGRCLTILTVPCLILIDTRQFAGLTCLPCGDEQTGTERFSDSPGDTQA